jgi:hypothetical protein
MGLAPSNWDFCLEVFGCGEVPVPIFSQPLRRGTTETRPRGFYETQLFI